MGENIRYIIEQNNRLIESKVKEIERLKTIVQSLTDQNKTLQNKLSEYDNNKQEQN